MSRPFLRAAAAALLGVTLATARANAHLLVTEVGYDPVDETGATAEFVEILNPDGAPVALDQVWLVGDEDAYPMLVNGTVSPISLNNFIYRFPAVSLASGGIVVVCHDSDAFLAEHFPAGLGAFQAQPGNPLLIEAAQDGAGDGVPDLIPYGTNPANTLSMANNGECVGLVTWNGTDDRVRDLDWVCWLTTTYIPNKDVDYPLGVDGPDPDHEVSFFAEDLALDHPAPDAPQGQAIHRTSLDEKDEPTSGGNGATGHDETSEDWRVWQVAGFSPGVCALANVSVADAPAAPGPGIAIASANPFDRAVRLAFSLPAAGRVRLSVHDVTGRTIATLLNDQRPAGRHHVTWDGTDAAGRGVPAGLYFARIECAGRVRSVAVCRFR